MHEYRVPGIKYRIINNRADMLSGTLPGIKSCIFDN